MPDGQGAVQSLVFPGHSPALRQFLRPAQTLSSAARLFLGMPLLKGLEIFQFCQPCMKERTLRAHGGNANIPGDGDACCNFAIAGIQTSYSPGRGRLARIVDALRLSAGSDNLLCLLWSDPQMGSQFGCVAEKQGLKLVHAHIGNESPLHIMPGESMLQFFQGDGTELFCLFGVRMQFCVWPHTLASHECHKNQ